MNAKQLLELWKNTSNDSLRRMIQIPEWRELAAKTLLQRCPDVDTLARAIQLLSNRAGRETITDYYESEIRGRMLTLQEIRIVLRCGQSLCDSTIIDLRRRLLGPEATVNELILLTADSDPIWREKAVTEVLKRKTELSYDRWKEGLLKCWGDEKHADISSRIWKEFRKTYPTLDFHELFNIAQWCPHVQDFVFKDYLRRRPEQIASIADRTHLLYSAAALILNEPAYGGALWVREDITEAQRSRLRQKAEKFVQYAKKLKKKTSSA